MKRNPLLFASVLVAFIFSSCREDSANTMFRLRLTDAPAALEEVNIDLRAVRLKMSGDTSVWIDMKTSSGIYNLLALQNGADTLISEVAVHPGIVREVRLILGSENSVKASGELYPLTIPSGSESGLKIKIDKSLRREIDSLTIDFDAALSIKQEQDGYKLRPVIRIAK